jgi:hypothetical protein
MFPRYSAFILTAALVASALLPRAAQALDNLFFLHHSTGRNIIEQGQMRDVLAQYNQDHGTDFVFWDHDYNYIGLREDGGDLLGYNYGVPGDNTDPDGLHILWTTANSARDSILANHQVIAFKSCYPASAIGSDAEIAQRQQWYLDMRDVFDSHPDHVFVVLSQPPLHSLATNVEQADRARAFASWLVSDEFTAGHPNVVAFDLFDLLAAPDDGSPTRNMLRYEYELNHNGSDSHPNALANEAVGPLLMTVMADAARERTVTGAPDRPTPKAAQVLGNHPNPFNPATTIRFVLAGPAVARLTVVDVRGHTVATLSSGPLPSGEHAVRWDGRRDDGSVAASGVYRVVLDAGGETDARPLTLIK